jgi:hypothetical protein
MHERPGSDPTLPGDVYASSRSRVPLIAREALTSDADRAAYDTATSDPRSLMGLRGPAGIALHNPTVAALARPLNRYLRFDAMDRAHAEIVMMCAARAMDQAFEWYAHENAARSEGVSEAVIAAIRDRTSTDGLPEREAAIVTYCREAMVAHAVSSETYAHTVRLFGVEQLYAMAVLAGQYLTTAVILHTFAQQLPPGTTSNLPLS